MANLFNRNISNNAHQALKQNSAQGIRVFAITPSGGWVIVTNRNKIVDHNIPEECLKELKSFQRKAEKIICVAFHPKGGNRWSIITSRNFFNRGIPDDCHKRMRNIQRSSNRATFIAFPSRNNKAWVVLTKNNSFFSSNIPDECNQIIRNIHQGKHHVHSVAFDADNDGWVILAGDYFFARDVDDELFNQLKEFNRSRWNIKNVVFDPDKRGWSIFSNTRFSQRLADPIRNFEKNVVSKSIWQQMRDRNVPGVAVAAVINNRIAWSCGYGYLKQGETNAVHPESVFQAASISKVLTTLGLLRAERLGLLDGITRLNSWSPSYASGVVGTVEPHQLLSHSGGTNVGGFGGYTVGSQVPTLLEVLNGKSPANSTKVRITYSPGTNARYSGGGFTILQQLLEDVSSNNFNEWMKGQLFDRIGMDSTSFDLAPFNSDNISAGHKSDGTPIQGDRKIYPEAAAAGAYTNVLDLARMMIFINRGGVFNRRQVLRQTQITDLLTPQHLFSASGIRGLGVVLNRRTNRDKLGFNYSHGGTNSGFRAAFRGFPNRNTGVVVLTNGSDSKLRWDIANSVASTYGWTSDN